MLWLSVDDLEKEYYDLSKASLFKSIEILDKESTKIKESHPNELHHISISERVDWLERRMEDFERTLVLINKNIVEQRQRIDERVDELTQKLSSPQMEYEQEIDRRLEKLENQGSNIERVKDELSSLNLLVKRTMEINDEIKNKTPQILRDFERKIENLHGELKKVKEDTNKDYWSRPIVLE